MDDVFGEENPLEFDQEEVKELLEILQSRLEGFPGDRKVFAGAERACEALRQDQSASDLRNNGN